MEYNGHDFLEELLTLRSEPWDSYTNLNIPTQPYDFYTTSHNVPTFSDNPFPNIPQSCCFDELPTLPFDQYHQTLNSSTLFGELCGPFGDDQAISAPEHTDSSNNMFDTPPFFPCQEEYALLSVVDDFEVQAAADACKMEPFQSPEVPSFNMGVGMEKRSKVKKLDGQPSKNLMAERRRRKRLNDRLSMLRSVVPKISKMDRTSILGDTIDYMKELLERINNLQEENEIDSNAHHQPSLNSIFTHVKPNEVLVRNSPKFDVERKDMDTRIEMCCATKPGLLLSTVTTLEALGLEIQQCVISCFNDFGMTASCSQEMEQRGNMSSEEIKQALFRNAGYGGRCL
ncbi:Beta HLH protein 93 [Heracleum sosnowskyi]|uniref:Beta HLH protein 93 n=1 Tax=Heracleum sosnowskyi TaxID=360622 RepID=A0AAD8IY89_9APIA|nr:Beta HLH protein 93 [Heracleum sosnowskyi]